MGKNFWGTDVQRKTLEKAKKRFSTYRSGRKTHRFWPEFFYRWFKKYPADKAIEKSRKRQIKYWILKHSATQDNRSNASITGGSDDFDTNIEDSSNDDSALLPSSSPVFSSSAAAGSSPSATSPPGPHSSARFRRTRKELFNERVLSLICGRRKPYTMPPHQAYSKLHFDKVRPTIRSNWKRELARLKSEDRKLQNLGDKALTAAVSGRKLAFTNEELKRLYDQESSEVKEEVELFRMKCKNYGDKKENVTKALEPVMETLLTNVYQETGMYVTVIAAGYSNRASKDSVSFKSFHVGTNEHGANFADWHEKWEKSIKNKFIKFYQESKGCQSYVAHDSKTAIVPKSHLCKEQINNYTNHSDDSEGYEEFSGIDESMGELNATDPLEQYVKQYTPHSDEAESPENNEIAALDTELSGNNQMADLRHTPLDEDGDQHSDDDHCLSTRRRRRRVGSAGMIDWDVINKADLVIQDMNDHSDVNQKGLSLSVAESQSPIGGKPKRGQKVPEYIRTYKLAIADALDGRCLGIVEDWEKFERNHRYPIPGGNLGKQNIVPIEIKEFMKYGDLSLVNTPADPAEYGRRWSAWWRALQPAWRHPKNADVDAPLKDQNYMPKKPNWKNLAVAGPNGIITAIIGLAIWSIAIRKSTRNRKVGKDLERNLQDVDLVLQMMTVNWRDD